MNEPTSVFDRFQESRTRFYVENHAKTQSWFPRLRSQRRRRHIVVMLSTVFAAMITGGVLAAFSPVNGALVFGIACLAFLPVWTILQTVSLQRGDAPVDALDEWEMAERNKARSLALTITQFLTAIPAFYLYMGALVLDNNHASLATSGAILVIACLFVGGCSPTMILSWTRLDPDPDDAASPQ